MTSPPFTYISTPTSDPIRAYIYSKSKLLYILTYPAFNQTLKITQIDESNVTVSTTSAITSTTGEWSIKANISLYIPAKGVIRITVPSIFTSYEANCRNDVIAGSTLNDLGFGCTHTTSGSNNYYIITLGDYMLAGGGQILIKANLLSPTTAQSTSWSIETFYADDSPSTPNLNRKMTEVLNHAGPSIVASSGTMIC